MATRIRAQGRRRSAAQAETLGYEHREYDRNAVAEERVISCRKRVPIESIINPRFGNKQGDPMGAWGHGIRQDDFVCDVIGEFDDLLKDNKSIAEASTILEEKFAGSIRDADDGPSFWIALADAQWAYGALDSRVLKQVKEDFDCGRGLERWNEDAHAFLRRKAVLEQFICKIAAQNPKPKKIPKTVVRPPKFKAGDCLSIRLENGQYAAALVLVADHSLKEYGKNLIGSLDYLSPEKPTQSVFKSRKWLVLTHHEWNGKPELAWYLPQGFRTEKGRLELVGNIEIIGSDPKTSNTYSGWPRLGEGVLRQREWDAKNPLQPSPPCPPTAEPTSQNAFTKAGALPQSSAGNNPPLDFMSRFWKMIWKDKPNS